MPTRRNAAIAGQDQPGVATQVSSGVKVRFVHEAAHEHRRKLVLIATSLVRAALDLSGRPCYVQRGKFTTDRVGQFPTEMVSHFFASLSQSLRASIHIEFRGVNNHHMIESMFKSVGRALRPALAKFDGPLPSTKGMI